MPDSPVAAPTRLQHHLDAAAYVAAFPEEEKTLSELPQEYFVICFVICFYYKVFPSEWTRISLFAAVGQEKS
jgi:hypothetical protein